MTNSRRIHDMAKALGERFSVSLEVANWQEIEFEGGVAFLLREAEKLRLFGIRNGDEVLTAYEMESLGREFPPRTFSLNTAGMKELTNSWMAHFELLLVPASRMWAVAVTPDMETFLFAPKNSLHEFCRIKNKRDGSN